MATSSNQDNKDENELHRLKKNTQDQLCRLVQEVRKSLCQAHLTMTHFWSIEFKLKLVCSDAICFQLTDLEDCRNDLEDDEYEEMRRDTIAQLSEFETSLAKLTSGMAMTVI